MDGVGVWCSDALLGSHNPGGRPVLAALHNLATLTTVEVDCNIQYIAILQYQ
jgi:hypothetical protein